MQHAPASGEDVTAATTPSSVRRPARKMAFRMASPWAPHRPKATGTTARCCSLETGGVQGSRGAVTLHARTRYTRACMHVPRARTSAGRGQRSAALTAAQGRQRCETAGTAGTTHPHTTSDGDEHRFLQQQEQLSGALLEGACPSLIHSLTRSLTHMHNCTDTRAKVRHLTSYLVECNLCFFFLCFCSTEGGSARTNPWCKPVATVHTTVEWSSVKPWLSAYLSTSQPASTKVGKFHNQNNCKSSQGERREHVRTKVHPGARCTRPTASCRIGGSTSAGSSTQGPHVRHKLRDGCRLSAAQRPTHRGRFFPKVLSNDV